MERQTLGNHPTTEKHATHYHHPVHVLRASAVTLAIPDRPEKGFVTRKINSLPT